MSVEKNSRHILSAGVLAILSALSSTVSFSLWTYVAKPIIEQESNPNFLKDVSYSFSFTFAIIYCILMCVVVRALKLHVYKPAEVTSEPYTNGIAAFQTTPAPLTSVSEPWYAKGVAAFPTAVPLASGEPPLKMV